MFSPAASRLSVEHPPPHHAQAIPPTGAHLAPSQGEEALSRPSACRKEDFDRRRTGAASCSTRHGSDRLRGKADRCPDSCDSIQPPAWRVPLVACCCAWAIVASTDSDQSTRPAATTAAVSTSNARYWPASHRKGVGCGTRYFGSIGLGGHGMMLSGDGLWTNHGPTSGRLIRGGQPHRTRRRHPR